ncbi:uncharacterized protein LOC144828153 [Lissotriton helveticus]
MSGVDDAFIHVPLAAPGAPSKADSAPVAPWVPQSATESALQEISRQVAILGKAQDKAVSVAPPVVGQAAPAKVETSTGTVKGKAIESANKPADGKSTAIGSQDTALSKRSKLAAHVSQDMREKIWKGEFIDIYSLIRPKRREVETKDKEGKGGSFRDRIPRVEKSITNWQFGFNVFSTVMLEKKPELAIPLLCYANMILKAHTTFGGTAWIDYDRDFRWAKVADPDLEWDQTEIYVWLESINHKAPMKQPFRTSQGGAGEKKGTCWAFNRKVCTWPPGACKFKHACAFCCHPSHPEFKCNKKSKDRGRDHKPPQQ